MLQKIINALNTMDTAWVAITVLIIGIAFSLMSKQFGLGQETASGVIGAGIGLLTGKAIGNKSNEVQTTADPTQK